MSGSTVDLFYDKNRVKFRWRWGNETFYDKNNQLIEFDTSLQALEWIKKEHPNLTVRVGENQMTLDMSDDKQLDK